MTTLSWFIRGPASASSTPAMEWLAACRALGFLSSGGEGLAAARGCLGRAPPKSAMAMATGELGVLSSASIFRSRAALSARAGSGTLLAMAAL